MLSLLPPPGHTFAQAAPATLVRLQHAALAQQQRVAKAGAAKLGPGAAIVHPAAKAAAAAQAAAHTAVHVAAARAQSPPQQQQQQQQPAVATASPAQPAAAAVAAPASAPASLPPPPRAAGVEPRTLAAMAPLVEREVVVIDED